MVPRFLSPIWKNAKDVGYIYKFQSELKVLHPFEKQSYLYFGLWSALLVDFETEGESVWNISKKMNVMQEFGKSWKHKSKVLLMCNDAKNCLVEHF